MFSQEEKIMKNLQKLECFRVILAFLFKETFSSFYDMARVIDLAGLFVSKLAGKI